MRVTGDAWQHQATPFAATLAATLTIAQAEFGWDAGTLLGHSDLREGLYRLGSLRSSPRSACYFVANGPVYVAASGTLAD